MNNQQHMIWVAPQKNWSMIYSYNKDLKNLKIIGFDEESKMINHARKSLSAKKKVISYT